ncbi:zinc ABC transporter substrate-binding protein [Anoxybacterium hadale]|uniref:Zinc ABC transporter substrate-binding protein n=1 Tax=Anoxybacterium hadale TaxID=3408580 RepID=A0ACD1AEW9_9FIRM|nr:zinc ABC transporter substrate-binding protein [Clostridiales bacterium]
MKKTGIGKILEVVVTAALAAALLLTGCSQAEQAPSGEGRGAPVSNETESHKPQVIATLFPQYDFAKQIAGDKADVILLLPPGSESHSYEPTPSDMIKIHKADVFLYTGESMEAWSHKLTQGLESDNSKCLVVDVSRGVPLVRTADIEKEHEHEHADGDHSDGEHPESEHSHIYDPHIWTDPQLAKIMVLNILEGLCSADPENADVYRANAAEYVKELDGLDQEFKTIINNAKRNEVIFGSRFAFYYFVKRYGLDYESAFDSCSAETEPSARTVKLLIDEIKEKKIPVIFYAELEEPKTAKALSTETGAKLLMLHSCHNVTKDEWERGATYLSLMKQNAENLKEGLSQ